MIAVSFFTKIDRRDLINPDNRLRLDYSRDRQTERERERERAGGGREREILIAIKPAQLILMRLIICEERRVQFSQDGTRGD